MSTQIIKILLADDHAMVREGLRQLLESHPDLRVIGEAKDGVEALELARKLRPEVILLDIGMPRMSGLEAVSIILEAVPTTRIIILTMYEKEAYAHQVLRAGAQGYVLKGSPSSDLIAAIRTVCRGEFYFSHKMHATLIEAYLDKGHDKQAFGDYSLLTDREKQVFLLAVHGNSTVEISKILCLSPKTVEKHRANLTRKLGVNSIVDMIRYALRIGVIDPEEWTS